MRNLMMEIQRLKSQIDDN